jgi:predicted nucleic acid-binding protein
MSDEGTPVCFVDSNIWLYAFVETGDESKRAAAHAVIQRVHPVLSTQVVNEVCVNLLRKAAMCEQEITELIEAFFSKYYVVPLSREVLVMASQLRQRYSFSFWDSLIVSSALACGAAYLYTEDMQHDLVVDQQLRLINPFVQ